MSSLDILNMAFRNLFKRKLRTFLTVFGVIIGVVSIVLMLSLGIGINMNFDKQMEGMGDLTIIRIYNWDGYYGNANSIILDDDMIKEIEKIDGVQMVTPILELNSSLNVVSGRYSAQFQILGIRPEAMAAMGYVAREGSLLSVDSQEFEIVYGSNVLQSFMTDLDRKRQQAGSGRRWVSPWDMMEQNQDEAPKVNVFKDRVTASYRYEYGTKNPEYPNNKKPDIYTLTGAGILASKENDWEASSYCFMDIKKVEKIKKDIIKYDKSIGQRGNTQTFYGYPQAFVKCTNIKKVESVMDDMVTLGFNKDYLGNPTSWINQSKQTASSLQALLAAIGAVALFVAAIGITNTMIMSIYERTREIGIMKVIGAAIKDIRKLFLLEAALIGTMGGILGIGFSYLASYLLNNVGLKFFEDMVYLPDGQKAIISFIPSWLALSSLAFATCIGLISGYLPARRAMKLSALSAIKTE